MRILALFCSVFVLFSTFQAEARPKPWYWSWYPSHWDNQDFKPYSQGGQVVANSQWEKGLYNDEDWHPENWIESKGSIRSVLDGFYNAEIIKSQDDDDGKPLLVVGDGFMRLSTIEKRRVTAFIDYAFQVTTSSTVGMYSIYYDRTANAFGRGEPIGIYTSNGLQMQ